ncbi:MAG: hypothetical protein ABFD89_26480 [Bryobacteraceae bacterium]
MKTFDLELPDGRIIEGIPEGTTKEQILAKLGGSAPKEVNPLVEAGKVLGSSVYGGLTAIPRAVMAGGDWLESKIPTPDALKLPIPGYGAMAEADQTIREGLRPETEGGQTAARIGEAGVAALLGPGGISAPVRTGLVGLASGGGAEIGSRLTGGNPLGAVAGGLTGGLLGGIATAAKTNRGALAREALEGVREDDLQTALQRMEAARQAGIPVNLSQAMPRDSNVDTYVDALASSRHGTKTAEMLRNQPAQVALGMEGQLADLPGQIRMPQVLANNAQEAATAAIEQAKRQRTTTWKEVFDRNLAKLAGNTPDQLLASGQVPQKAVAGAYQKLTDLAATVPNTSKQSMLLSLRDRLVNGDEGFITDAVQLNEILKDAAGQLKPINLATKGLDAGAAKWVGAQIGELRDDFGKAFLPIQKANQAYKAMTEGVVDPLKKSVVGRIAGRAGANDAIEAPQARLFSVFDRGTVPGAKSSEILTLEKALRQAGQPEVFQDAAKTWLATKVSDAMRSTTNRMPQDVASRLRTAFGDPRQLDATSKGLEDVLAGLARSQGVPDAAYVKGFKNFMKIVADASRRPASVRGTSFGQIEQQAQEGITRRLGQVSIMTPIRQPALFWARLLEQDALRTMDNLMTSPEGVATLVKLGKMQPYSQSAVATMATFLGTMSGVNNTPDVTQQ